MISSKIAIKPAFQPNFVSKSSKSVSGCTRRTSDRPDQPELLRADPEEGLLPKRHRRNRQTPDAPRHRLAGRHPAEPDSPDPRRSRSDALGPPARPGAQGPGADACGAVPERREDSARAPARCSQLHLVDSHVLA